MTLLMLLQLAWSQELGAPEAPAPITPLEAPQDTGLDEAPQDTATPATVREWQAPGDDVQRQRVLGPWPDGYAPGNDFQRGLDLVDPLSGQVLQPGDPYVEGLLHGPIAPVRVDPEPTPGLQPPPADQPLEPDLGTSDVELPELDAQTAQNAALEPAHDPKTDSHWRALPQTPEPSLSRALLAALSAVLLLLLARGLERGPLTRLPSRGALPLGLRGGIVALRLGVLTLMLLAGLLVLPRSIAPAQAYVFVALALAVGWTSRHVLVDFLAGVVLVIEHRLTPGSRVRVAMPEGKLVGVVESVGIRFVRVSSDQGDDVAVPNRLFLDKVVTRDNDHFIPVEVRLHVPFEHDARTVRRKLEELALLSPWLAPIGSPEIHRDTDLRDVWIVRARLVNAQHALAFRGTMVELADEVLGARRD